MCGFQVGVRYEFLMLGIFYSNSCSSPMRIPNFRFEWFAFFKNHSCEMSVLANRILGISVWKMLHCTSTFVELGRGQHLGIPRSLSNKHALNSLIMP